MFTRFGATICAAGRKIDGWILNDQTYGVIVAVIGLAGLLVSILLDK